MTSVVTWCKPGFRFDNNRESSLNQPGPAWRLYAGNHKSYWLTHESRYIIHGNERIRCYWVTWVYFHVDTSFIRKFYGIFWFLCVEWICKTKDHVKIPLSPIIPSQIKQSTWSCLVFCLRIRVVMIRSHYVLCSVMTHKTRRHSHVSHVIKHYIDINCEKLVLTHTWGKKSSLCKIS